MATRAKSRPKANPKPKGSAPASDIMTLKEAATFLRVTEEQLLTEVQVGAVPARSLGGEWRLSRPALLRWLAGPPTSRAERDRLLSVDGCLADDDTLEPMVEKILAERGRDTAGAST